jgi:hypothetical protein
LTITQHLRSGGHHTPAVGTKPLRGGWGLSGWSTEFDNFSNFYILSFDILSFDILSFDILSFDILSFDILGFDIVAP